MNFIFDLLTSIPALQESMSRLSQANITHSQYAAAMENLKHLLNVSDTIEKTHEYIIDGKLLYAHKKLLFVRKEILIFNFICKNLFFLIFKFFLNQKFKYNGIRKCSR